MEHPIRSRRAARRLERQLAGLWNIIMLDAILAFARRLNDDDNTFGDEIAALEAAKVAAEQKQAADEQALADLQAKVAGLAAPVDTSAFATAADLKALRDAMPDVSGLAKQADLDALRQSLEDLDTEVGSLGTGTPPVAPAPGPAPGSNPITVDASAVPTSGLVGDAFAANVVAAGGSGPLTFAIDSGALPDGLSMAAGGAITGTLQAGGEFTCDVAVSDANGDVGHATVAISVLAEAPAPEPEPAPEIDPEPAPEPAV